MTPALAMVLAALIPTARWRNVNGRSCLILDVTPWPNPTRKTFHRIVHLDTEPNQG